MRWRHVALLFMILIADLAIAGKIDRYRLVTRHNPVNTSMDVWSPFTVGNGSFAFTVDPTGLQTFSELYEKSIPLCTLSEWAWHTIPDSQAYDLSSVYQPINTYGRKVDYAAQVGNAAAKWLRANPHRLHLGRIGFEIRHKDGSPALPDDFRDIRQTLDMWTGILHSEFTFEDVAVRVETVCDPDQDQLAVSVFSPLLIDRRLKIFFHFPYGSSEWGSGCSDWQQPHRHETRVTEQTAHMLRLQRHLDSTRYQVMITSYRPVHFISTIKHRFLLQTDVQDRVDFICRFSLKSDRRISDIAKIFRASKEAWKNFWTHGAAVDLSACTDSSAKELERRVILSQYLTRIQCSGFMPPQETGLTCNSWFGKAHLEMHWWHAAHFALWGRPQLLEKSMSWYRSILPKAAAEAQRQGYRGVRWPKMVGPDGQESPSSVGVFLIWQQPHPIYFAELLYRLQPDNKTLKKYQDIVFQTADFLASFAVWDSTSRRYLLGPPLIPAQECHAAGTTMNPLFELAYWRFGLQTAQKWRERLKMSPDSTWAAVLAGLSALPTEDGLYVNAESDRATFTDSSRRCDHPTLLAALGMLADPGVDVETMRRTLKKVMTDWNWSSTWGWDYPLVAMTAARLGEPELALQALLMPVEKNRYLHNGHNYQRENLPIYLPGNGGLLTAVAMMAAGWDGAPVQDAPGFPKNGRWQVKWEGLQRMP